MNQPNELKSSQSGVGQSRFRYMAERYWFNPHYWIDCLVSERVDGGGAETPNSRCYLVVKTPSGSFHSYEKYSIEFHDDGRSIYVGAWENDNIHKWQGSWDASVFRSFALWYLKRWVVNDWFGLRSWLHFKWLSYKANHQPKIKQ